MKKSIVFLLILSMLFSFAACGGGAEPSDTATASVSDSDGDASGATKPSDTQTDPKPEEEVRKPTPGQLPTETSNLVLAGDQARKRVIVYDADCYDGKNLEKCVVWSHTPDGAGIIAGLRYRSDTVFGNVILICAGGRFASIVTYNDAKTLWKTKNAGSNPHSVEILPDGNVVVGSSTDGKITLFHTSVLVEKPNTVSADITSETYTLEGAHGVLWDPEYDCLWINGDKTLSAYAIGGTKDAPKFVELGMHYTVEGGMHDLAPCYGDPDSLFVTCAEGILRFDKKAEIFSTSYVGSKAGVPAKYAPGCGNFEDGVFVFTSIEKGKTVYEEWCTNEVKVYVPVGAARGALLTRKAPNDAYYKVRVWCTDYQ